YATVEDGICTRVPVVGTGFPATWALEKIDCKEREGGDGETGGNMFRIRWPNSHYVMDLEGYRSDKDSTKVSL
ncbi:hypothetical protein C8R42DRAFT_536626, partial [Lentinula raphanica]